MDQLAEQPRQSLLGALDEMGIQHIHSQQQQHPAAVPALRSMLPAPPLAAQPQQRLSKNMPPAGTWRAPAHLPSVPPTLTSGRRKDSSAASADSTTASVRLPSASSTWMSTRRYHTCLCRTLI